MSEMLEKARAYEALHGGEITPEERPAFHFTPYVGWTNDPNGFSMYRGAAHLFYQYYPYDTVWGPMHWGHARTTDFLHWEYLPAVMAPDRDYDCEGCFSGSAVETADGQQLLLYTGVRRNEAGEIRQTQCIAVGDGENYTKYEGNPVLTAADLPEDGSHIDFRDPKLWWEDGSYYAVAGNMTEDGSGAIRLFSSEDGFHWHYERTVDRCRNEYGKMWECPDYFPLEGRQVLLVSPQFMQAEGLEFHNGNDTVCLIGDIDPETGAFRRDRVQNPDYGLDFYAPQTLQTPDGRRILIAWMQSWETVACKPAGARWFGMMTLPRELSIKNGRLIQTPVRELEACRRNPVKMCLLCSGRTEPEGVSGRTMELILHIRPQEGFERLTLQVAADEQRHTDVIYDRTKKTVTVDRSFSGFPYDITHRRAAFVREAEGILELRVLLDRFSAEIFVNGGEQVLSSTIYTSQSADRVRLIAEGTAEVELEKFDIV